MLSRRIFLTSLLMCLLVSVAIPPLLSQDATIITITAPGWVSRVFGPELFARFEAQYPGVKVVAVEPGSAYAYTSAAENIQEHLAGAQNYVSIADVVYVDRFIASVEATRAGYFMNLAPFVASDATANTEDFFPAIWQSAQWDNGTWYIPASAYVEMLAYNTAAFDAAGLAYPSERWTFDDFARAARELTVYDAAGKVAVPGFMLYNPALFYYALTKQPLYDVNSSPSIPDFDQPELIAFYEQWKALEQEITATGGSIDYSQIAFQFGAPWRLSRGGGSGDTWDVSLLPGGATSLSIEGFGVSGGTLNPEMAYALANFMSNDPQVIEAFSGDTSARRSLLISDPSKDAPAIEEALASAVPISELRFHSYVDAVLTQTPPEGETLDMRVAIQNAQLKAEEALAFAADQRPNTVIYVTTPVPTPSMTSDQIVLRFGIGMDTTSNADVWAQLINDYLAANPAVGNVELDTDFFDPKEQDALDCFYLPYNLVPSMQLDKFLSLNPLMDADPTFSRQDFINTLLEQVQRDDRIWAYPIMFQPSVLWYDADLFERAGLASPEAGWTIDGFEDALQTLKGYLTNETDPVFESGMYGNTYLLMLIAAYGGLPYDYRTTPPTVDFTSAESVNAIRQVLDLAKSGSIRYLNLVDGGSITLGEESDVPISDDILAAYSMRVYERSQGIVDTFRIASYPQGSQYTPMSFGIGAGYIHAHAQNPEACYNFIVELAKHPDLFGGMPVRISQANDPMVATAHGEDVAALYQTLITTFQQPNTIIIPTQFGAPDSNLSSYLEPLWMNRAFDRYVLEDADLETELAAAEGFITGYRTCASNIVITDVDRMPSDEVSAYFQQFTDCALQVDPTMEEHLSHFYQ